MNPFESGERRVVPATLIYLFCQNKVLMIHRIKKNKDIHEGKWNGIGGKLELEESPEEGAIREIKEESGISLLPSQLKPMGVLTFPSFKVDSKTNFEQDWICFLFRADLEGSLADYKLVNSDEGHLEWVDQEKIITLPLWDGDYEFIPKVIQGKAFIGTYWYKDKKLIKYTLKDIC
ncbi:MAG: 8-oxo-dGTP diphosphatase [Bdellovibrionota bacterium]